MGNKTKTSILITVIDVLSSAQAWRGKKKKTFRLERKK